MQRWWRDILVMLVLVLLSSCVTTRRIRYMQDPDLVIPDYSKVEHPEDYRVQVLDELSVQVSTLDPQMNKLFNLVPANTNVSSGDNPSAGQREYVSTPGFTSYTVERDSAIYMPYIGKVKVAGLTTREIKRVLTDSLATMVSDIDVNVRLMNSYFSVVRSKSAGRYAIPKERMNIFQALAISGDLSEMSDRARVKIVRQTPSGSIVKTFDVRSSSIVDSEFYYIQPNDVIYVQDFNGQFFGITSFSALYSVISSVVSLVLVLVNLKTVF